MTEEKSGLREIEDVTRTAQKSRLDAEVLENAPRLRGKVLTFALACVAGTGFTLFGCEIIYFYPKPKLKYYRYDQGVMSALLTARQVHFPHPQSL